MDWIAAHNGKFQLFINTEWRDPSTKEWYPTINPATKQKLSEAKASYGSCKGALSVRHCPSNSKTFALFAVLETMNNGNPIRETRDIDIPLVARHFYYHSGWAKIIPWNFPMLMLSWKVAPALAMGNVFVIPC